MKWRNLYRGFIMGTSDLVPGVSGGTIAVLLGIYDELIAAINGFFSREWKKHFFFLFPLGLGMVTAIFTLSKVMKWLLDFHPKPTHFLFLGLILGILPNLFAEINVKKNFKGKHVLLLLISMMGTSFLDLLQTDQEIIITHVTLMTYVLFFCAGFLGSVAMVLPGISGSFILLVLGVYYTIIAAIESLKFDIILVTGLGIGVGIIVMSKFIHYLLTNFRIGTFAVIIGMVIGSTVVIFPGWAHSLRYMFLCIFTFAIGLLIAYFLGKIEYRE